MLEGKDRERLDKVNLMLLPGTVLLKKKLCKIIENDPDPRAFIFLSFAFLGFYVFNPSNYVAFTHTNCMKIAGENHDLSLDGKNIHEKV